MVKRIRGGAVIALVSDAGMPLVSDPGWALLQECIAAGVPVEVLPGPSSLLTALVASGLPAERWRFVGFLPRKRGELEHVLGKSRETLVAFESPGRLPATLEVASESRPHPSRRQRAWCSLDAILGLIFSQGDLTRGIGGGMLPTALLVRVG